MNPDRRDQSEGVKAQRRFSGLTKGSPREMPSLLSAADASLRRSARAFALRQSGNVHRVVDLNVFSRRPKTTFGRTSKIGPIFGSSVNDVYLRA